MYFTLQQLVALAVHSPGEQGEVQNGHVPIHKNHTSREAYPHICALLSANPVSCACWLGLLLALESSRGWRHHRHGSLGSLDQLVLRVTYLQIL